MPDMDMPEAPLDPAALTVIVASHVDVDPDTIRLERCETGKFNTTYFVEGTSPPMVLRVAPQDDRELMLFYEHRMMRQEPGIHAAIQSHTTVSIPTILAYAVADERIQRDYLLMERMAGTPLSDHSGLGPADIANVLREVGDALRQVHQIHGEAYGYVGPHAPMPPQSDWTSAFVVMWNALIDDTERCGGYHPDEATFMRKLLDKHIRVFNRTEPASLLHMDVWAQNVLADDQGRMTCLLDWDRAVWGDPEIEFAVLDYCGISEAPFWEGYGQPRETSPEAELRRIFYLLYELQKYILIRRVRNHSPDRADEYRVKSLRLAKEIA